MVFAALILKEQVHVYRWTAVGVGFSGVILMLSPYLGSHVAMTASMMSGLAFALINAVTIRRRHHPDPAADRHRTVVVDRDLHDPDRDGRITADGAVWVALAGRT